MLKNKTSIPHSFTIGFFSMILIFFFAFPLLTSGQNADIDLLHIINQNRNKQLDDLLRIISSLTGPLTFGVLILFLVVALVKKHQQLKRKTWFLITAVLTSVVLTNLLKYSISRPRPFETYSFIEKLSAGGSPSFPSGHTSDAFVLALALSIAFRKKWLIILSFLWAFIVAYSRMSLGVHYPSDVLAGASIGIFSAIICYLFFRETLSET